MSFPWSKKMIRVLPAPPPSPEVPTEPEVVQIVVLPEVRDKISGIEHKNGEQVDCSRKEDDEDDEVEGDVQEGGWAEESDHGGEEALEETRGR